MMGISRDNYEVWFIDFLDGKLNQQAREELNTFLQANPDLEEELNAFEELNLEPSTICFDAPERLLKGESDLMEISRPDYLLVKQMEEGLSDPEEKELAVEIRKDESLIKRGVEFQQTKLSNEPIRYNRKSSLFQKRIPAGWHTAWRIGAVGIVAGFLLIFGDAPKQIFNSGTNEIVMERLDLRPVSLSAPNIPEPKLAKVNISDLANGSLETNSVNKRHFVKAEDEYMMESNSNSFIQEPMVKLSSKGVEMDLAGSFPNAYEAGLRQMMPMYLDINRDKNRMITSVDSPKDSKAQINILTRGLQLVDRVSGDLVQFDKLYDKDGNFVAYNLKAGNFEVERKLRR
jgi:hypothetical protein